MGGLAPPGRARQCPFLFSGVALVSPQVDEETLDVVMLCREEIIQECGEECKEGMARLAERLYGNQRVLSQFDPSIIVDLAILKIKGESLIRRAFLDKALAAYPTPDTFSERDVASVSRDWAKRGSAVLALGKPGPAQFV